MAKRLIEISTTDLFDSKAIATRFSGREEISRPFSFEIEIQSPRPDVKPGDVIGKPFAIRLDRGDGSPRWFHGYIHQLWAGNFISTDEKKGIPSRSYRVQVVPWTWFMTRSARSFVYLPEKEKKSIREVIDKLLERVRSYKHVDPAIELGSASILGKMKVEHCVQYRETDFNFLSRILEQYGVFYYFKHEEKSHKMMLSDQPVYPTSEDAEVEYPGSTGSRVNENSIQGWEHGYQFVSGKYQVDDFDFESPASSLRSNASKHASVSLSNNANYEIYDSPNDFKTRDEGREEAMRRLEEAEVHFNSVRATSNCMMFSAGYTFKLTKHFACSTEQGKEYLIRSIYHDASQPGPFSGPEENTRYFNQLECVPKEVRFRPDRLTPSPAMSSIQTGIVVGPSGEEIYTDKFGRVKVQFHWDREGKGDENTSCWIRCKQSIAGNRWGSMAIPRVGQEVVVEFVEGDPNRPLITGCVYNGIQMPGYKLPDDKNKTYLKTNSTPGGKGHNELMIDDSADAERIYLHAQKDFDLRVLNDTKERIFGNRHEIVGWEKDGKKGGDKREMVYQDRHSNIKRHQIEHIEGNYECLIGEGKAEEGGCCDIVIEKQKSEKIGGDNHLTIEGNHMEKISGDLNTEVGGNVQQKSGGNIAQESGPMGEVHIKAGMKVIIEAGVQLSLIGPGGFIDIGPAGVTVQGILVKINSGGAAGKGKGCKTKPAKAPKKAKPVQPTLPGNSTSGSASNIAGQTGE